jgi:hypothetical protein
LAAWGDVQFSYRIAAAHTGCSRCRVPALFRDLFGGQVITVFLPKIALRLAVQMEAVSESFLEVPQGVYNAVDRTENIISRRWNLEREAADPAKLRKQAFSVEKPRIRQPIWRKSLWGAHASRRWIK